MYKSLIILFFFIFTSCAIIYTGSYKLKDLNLIQPNELGKTVSKWEDGARTTGKSNEFEWWYFDAKFADSSLFVCYFYKIHFFKDRYFIGLNYNPKDGDEFFKLKYFNKKEVSFSKDSCSVRMGDNYLIGNLDQYRLFLDPKDFDGFGVDLSLQSTVKPYRPQDGIIKAGEDFFAWLAAVPSGLTKGYLISNGDKKTVSGDGYHDHNWGNTPLQRLFDSWTWFRAQVEDFTIIAAELNLSDKRGGYNIPILYIANEEKVFTNRYGTDGIFTKYSDRINDLYNKKNEPLFSTVEMITKDGILIKIEGNTVIDNSDIFKRMGVPMPIRWAMNKSQIDPYYTRFNSNVSMSLKNQDIKSGYGVLEIMDLK